MKNLTRLFDKHQGEFLEFDRIPECDRLHPRPDLCALLYLHGRLGGEGDAIDAAEHDQQVWLSFGGLSKLTEGDAIYLLRCGVSYDERAGMLYMFV